MAIPSDTHCGSVVGLMPGAGSWVMANGGSYTRNKIQDIIYEQWLECWQMVADMRKRSRLVIIHAGDATEGIHHETTQIVSNRIDEQERIHVAAMLEAMKISKFNEKRGDRMYYIGGTPTHVLPGQQSEERIARVLATVPKLPGNNAGNDGRYLWDRWRMWINGVLFDVAHEGPHPGSRAWLRGNTLRWVLRSMYFDCLEHKLEMPRYWIRAHRHRWVPPERHRGEAGTIEGFLTPCFQGPTEYVFQRFSMEFLSHIGMLVFIVEPDGRTEWECNRVQVIMEDAQELE